MYRKVEDIWQFGQCSFREVDQNKHSTYKIIKKKQEEEVRNTSKCLSIKEMTQDKLYTRSASTYASIPRDQHLFLSDDIYSQLDPYLHRKKH